VLAILVQGVFSICTDCIIKWLVTYAFILLCKQNILFCDVELVLKCVLIMYAEFLFVIVNLSRRSKTIRKSISYTASFLYYDVSRDAFLIASYYFHPPTSKYSQLRIKGLARNLRRRLKVSYFVCRGTLLGRQGTRFSSPRLADCSLLSNWQHSV
jgi:hypothetical protein